ncbi:hypothetical protein STVA_20110 [Allostella vacuolata]|nr:hypothetical protein STVA_20110 [Stella vacuolata]
MASPPDDVLCRRFGVPHLHRLHNNENPLGPPPAAARVLRDWPSDPAIIYPQGDGWHLRHRLAAARAMTAFRCPGWLRVSLGASPVMEAFAGALAEVLEGG